MQQSKYSVFHNKILLFNLVFHSRVLLSYSCQCLTTETFAQDDRGYTTETLSISYIFYSYKTISQTLFSLYLHNQ